MSPGPGKEAARRRQIALAALAVGVLLLLSSTTWFSTHEAVAGVVQLLVALVLLGVGAVLLRRSRPS